MRSGLKLGVAGLALALSLAGCDQIKQMTGMDQSAGNTTAATTNTTAPSLTTPGAGAPAKPVAAANPALAAQMTLAADQIRAQLPIRIDQITQVVGIRAEGTEFVYDVMISQPIPGGNIEQARATIQGMNQTSLCNNPDTRRLITMGGSLNHRYTDSAGNRFETRVVSCS